MGVRSAQEIWEAALGELQVQVSQSNYRTWLQKTKGLSYQDSEFVIGVPSTFVAEYLDQKQRSLIEKTLISITHQDTRAVFYVNGQPQGEAPLPPLTAPPIFNPKYTFSSFIEGNGNRLAYAHALAVASKSGQSYNPLFIFGGPGLGKTHLLHAVGHVALTNHLKVLYVSAEQFTNEFISAIRERKSDEFCRKFRSVDILMIDDIHFISGKKQTEESFFHTFNELHDSNRQIIITSDRHPKDMSLLEERLRSRLEWGLITDIQPPDFETRRAILQAKAQQQQLIITSDVLELIAGQNQQNIRELEGSLNRVIAYARLFNAAVTRELAAQALADITATAKKPITPGLVIEAVANAFQLPPSDLIGRKRDKETALARQVAMYLIKRETNCSLTQIGQDLGSRAPSTVSHACEKIADDINSSPYLRKKILNIHQIIYPATKTPEVSVTL